MLAPRAPGNDKEAASERDSDGMNTATGTTTTSARAHARSECEFPSDKIERLVHADGLHVAPRALERVREEREARLKARSAKLAAAARIRADARQEPHQVVAAALGAVHKSTGKNTVDAAAEHVAETAMQSKKKQKLLEKVAGGRSTAKVMGSAPVGAAAISMAPKLSEFHTAEAHTVAMRAWCAKNLPKKALEKETRVCQTRSNASMGGVELSLYQRERAPWSRGTGQVLGMRRPL